MTTSTFSAQVGATSDAIFRDWGSKFSAALAAVGMVKTADTGQINWTTVVVGAANTQVGYEVWQFNDALQATAPIFLRIGYGQGATSCGSFWWTIGKGSDGAGNITGVIQAAAQNGCSLNITATATNYYVSSGDGSMLTVAPALATVDAATSCLWFFALDRSRNAAGAATATGLWMIRNSAASVVGTAYNYAAASSWNTNMIPAAIPSTTGTAISLAAGGKAPLFSAVVTDGAGNMWQPRAVLVGMRADTGLASPITVPDWGTYLPLGFASQNCIAGGGTNTSACIGWW